jgi:hypothetical protein
MTGNLLTSIVFGVLAIAALSASGPLIYRRFVRPWFQTQIRRTISMARRRPAKRNLDLLAEFTSTHMATRSKLYELRNVTLPHRPIFETGARVGLPVHLMSKVPF